MTGISNADSKFWTLVDEFNHGSGLICTYEHALPNGKLILTEHRWQSHLAATVIFVPFVDVVPNMYHH